MINNQPHLPGRLLGINGQMSSGKSTAARILVDNGWEIVKFSGPLKQITGYILSESGHHLEDEINAAIEGPLKNVWLPSIGMTPRKMMQQIGSAYRFLINDPSLWCDIGINDANMRRSRGIDVAIDDTRFPDPEVTAIRNNGGMVWGIRRPNMVPQPETEADRELVARALARPMTSEYQEFMEPIFESAFISTMEHIWPREHRISLPVATEVFSGEFIDRSIRPEMSDKPVEVNLLAHVSEVPIDDKLLDTVIHNTGSLEQYQNTIRENLNHLNEQRPRPTPEPSVPAPKCSSPSP